MRIVPALTLALVFAGPAMAQNDSVTVNGDGSGQTLIDPATGQSRYVPALLQPWQDEAIHLRPPGHHRAKRPATTTDTTPTTVVEPPPPPKKKRVVAVTPPPAEAPRPAATPKPVKAPPPSGISGFADIDLI